ncbi:MAG: hypothetical protein WKF85_15545 [Chitinophagaceae bacterium]
MKLTLKYLLLIIYLTFSISCNKPPYQCDSFPNQSIEIKIINQQGQNLFFGANSRYLIDSIRVLTQQNNFGVHNASVQKGFIDSNNLLFHFYTPEAKSYIYYNNQTSHDSLEINWVIKITKCERGGTLEYNAVESVKFNSFFINSINGVYTFIK